MPAIAFIPLKLFHVNKNKSFLKREIQEKSKHFFPLTKKLNFLSGQGPPPLADMSAKYFDGSPKGLFDLKKPFF